MNKSHKTGLSVIIYSTMCLEALINRYGIAKSSKSYFNNYLNKLDIKSKWIIVPRLFTGESISTGGQPFELLKKLISNRNSIVHFKPLKFSDNSKGWEKINKEIKEFFPSVYDAFKALCHIIIELRKIDSVFFEDTVYTEISNPDWCS